MGRSLGGDPSGYPHSEGVHPCGTIRSSSLPESSGGGVQLHRHLAGRQLEHLGGVRGGQTVTEDSTEEPVVNSSTLARRRDASCSVAPQETLMPTIGYGLHDPRGERRGLERLSVGVQRGPDGSGELGSQPPIRSGVAAG